MDGVIDAEADADAEAEGVEVVEVNMITCDCFDKINKIKRNHFSKKTSCLLQLLQLSVDDDYRGYDTTVAFYVASYVASL